MRGFVYPNLPWKYLHLGLVRFSGAGLGNLLFPWARAMIYSYTTGLKPIWPTWPQIYLSRSINKAIEYVKRHYFFVFKPTDKYVTGIRKFVLLTTRSRVRENQWPFREDSVIMFEGMNGLFEPLRGFHDYLREELLSIISPRHLSLVIKLPTKSIALHVRMGDLAIPLCPDDVKNNPGKYRVPLSWYLKQIDQCKNILGFEWPIFIFTDGKDEEIAPLLGLRNVQLVRTGSPVADLLSMSSSRILIAGASTFAMWASFLGQTNTIWYSGHHLQKLIYIPDSIEVETDVQGNLPDDCLSCLKEL